MGRPKKDPDLLQNIPLRVMLTADQRALIEEAAKAEGMDMTAWARPILVAAARAKLAEAGPKKKRPK